MNNIETILLAVDDYDISSLKSDEELLLKHLFQETDGYWSLASANYDSYKTIVLLTKYLFGNSEKLTEIFREEKVRIIDLTEMNSSITTSEKVEDWYQDWINESKRENNMDEYGQLISLISYVQRQQNKKNLLLIIRES